MTEKMYDNLQEKYKSNVLNGKIHWVEQLFGNKVRERFS